MEQLVSVYPPFDGHPDSAGSTRDEPQAEVGARPVIYGEYYGLRENPFAITSDPRFLFLTSPQREALSNLRYGLVTPRGFTLLIGEAGTGKTTLIRTILAELNEPLNRYILITNPTLTRAEFYEPLVREFGLSGAALISKSRFLAEFQQDLEDRFAAGGLTGLIIDEAQSLPHELLEEIRLLGNIETPTAKLLNIVFAGQPELAARLNDESLRQLKQRITLRCTLAALTLEDTAAYIAGRIHIVGGAPGEIFTQNAVIAIHHASAGIPRTINILCDNALIGGYAAQTKPIPVRLIEEIVRDFDLGKLSSPNANVVGGDSDTSRLAQGTSHTDSDESTFGSVARKKRFSFFR